MVAKYGPANGFGWQLNEVIGAQIVSVPMVDCTVHYIDTDPAEKGPNNKAPTPALLKFYAEQEKNPVRPVPMAARVRSMP